MIGRGEERRRVIGEGGGRGLKGRQALNEFIVPLMEVLHVMI